MNENPIWKEFEVTLKDRNGNVKLGSDGKPMIAISPPPSDLVGRVFLTKPDKRGKVNRAEGVELTFNQSYRFKLTTNPLRKHYINS
jgi:hypothetical protein